MKARGFFVVALALLAWSGCAAIAGLGDYEIVDEVDATTDASPIDTGLDSAPPDTSPARDASVDADAEPVDAGPCGACRGRARTVCVENACVDARRVFVTRRGFAVAFSPPTRADAECQTVADAAKLGGTWKAWLSASGSRPRDRMTFADVPYRLLDGTRIAATGSHLRENGTSIEHGIDLDENAVKIEGPVELEVWTGTQASGGVADKTCNNWASAAKTTAGVVGLVDRTAKEWTAAYEQECDRITPHLYCFEQ